MGMIKNTHTPLLKNMLYEKEYEIIYSVHPRFVQIISVGNVVWLLNGEFYVSKLFCFHYNRLTAFDDSHSPSWSQVPT